MSLALLQTALLMPLEFTINKLLMLDAGSHARLARLQSRTLALHITTPDTVLYIRADSRGLHLSPVFEGEVSASLHGPASAMLGLLLQSDKASNLQASNLELRGNTAFVEGLQNLLLDLDLDWEFQLSRIIGDLPTQALGSGLRQTQELLQTTGRRLKEDATEYLFEESALLPAGPELEFFYTGIDELVLHLDRLEARFDLLSRSA